MNNEIKIKKPKKGFMDVYKTYDASKGFGNANEWKQTFKATMNFEDAVVYIAKNSPYSILEVSENATKEEIKFAFRRLSKIYHPDINKDVDISIMQNIIAAYTILNI